MTNPKIERVSKEIDKTKTAIAEQTAKLRELERQRTSLEDAALVAMFRKEKLTDNDLAELLRMKSSQTATKPGAAVREESEARV